jgi:hypothetical protein
MDSPAPDGPRVRPSHRQIGFVSQFSPRTDRHPPVQPSHRQPKIGFVSSFPFPTVERLAKLGSFRHFASHRLAPLGPQTPQSPLGGADPLVRGRRPRRPVRIAPGLPTVNPNLGSFRHFASHRATTRNWVRFVISPHRFGPWPADTPSSLPTVNQSPPSTQIGFVPSFFAYPALPPDEPAPQLHSVTLLLCDFLSRSCSPASCFEALRTPSRPSCRGTLIVARRSLKASNASVAIR